MEHDLKTAPEHFEAVWSGAKTAELRKDDRGFSVGDVLRLREWSIEAAQDWWEAWMDAHEGTLFTDPETIQARQDAPLHGYTGRELRRTVTHVLRGGPWLAEGFVMLSLGEAR